MVKKMLIDATHAEETRVVVVDGNKVEEFDFETVNKRQLAGNIYLAKVTRVEPSLQAAFVDYGGNRHGFLAFAEIHPDYYQIPVADRKALLEEERAYARAQEEEENGRRRATQRSRPAAAAVTGGDAVLDGAPRAAPIAGMDVVDLGEETGADALYSDAGGDRREPLPDAGHDTGDDAGPEAGRDFDADTAADAGADTAADAGADTAADTDTDTGPDPAPHDAGPEDDAGSSRTYVAAEGEDEIESVADEDVAEEISQVRKPRPRRFKIQEVVKVRQIMLVQVVKEERGNKGAALTTYLSLAGRYCVLMPNTARGGGISRKITQAADRKKLKEIAQEIEVPDGAGLIIRTAGAKRTKAEIKRDYEYLMRLWEQVRELTLKSIAPAPIYEEGNLIKRSIRDLYNREIEEVLVEGVEGYRVAKDFMKMIMPSHAKAVQPYTEPMPLFARYQVESYLGAMFNPTVQLKSGGYIVIGVTEALVAIDVNSGRATKEGSIEQTALNTNLEAAEEIARQLRLRDLAGLIVIDFIDMEERKNNAAVEKRLKDKLKTDRARIQVGRISGFGLLEMSRQRLRPGMLESTTQPCPHCHGTGLIRSDDSLALQVLRQLEEEGTRKRSKEVLLKAPVAVVNYLMNQKREHIALIEARYGMAVRIEADPALVSPDYAIEKFKTATRVVAEMPLPVVSADSTMMPDLDEEEDIPPEADDVAEAEEMAGEPAPAAAAASGDNPGPKKKRRRRRRRKGAGAANGTAAVDTAPEVEDEGEGEDEDDAAESPAEAPAGERAPTGDVTDAEPAAAAEAAAEPPVAKKTSRSRKTAAAEGASAGAGDAGADGTAPKRRVSRSSRTSRSSAAQRQDTDAPAPAVAESPAEDATAALTEPPVAATSAAAEPLLAEPAMAKPVMAEPVMAEPVTAEAVMAEAVMAEPVMAEPVMAAEADLALAVRAEPAPAPQPEAPLQPKRRGWWSAR
jgi:ribonuclease E